jgi:hypothetical protein
MREPVGSDTRSGRAVGVALVLGSMMACAAGPPSETRLSDAAAQEIEHIERAYGVRVVRSFRNPGTTRTIRDVQASSARPRNVERYLPLLREELSRHPKDLLRCAEVREIALVEGLVVGGQRRAAAPMRRVRTLILDVDAPGRTPEYERWTFHHELFHMIDMSQDELIRADSEWSRLNPAGFVYGAGGDRVYHDPETAYRWSAPPPGFVTLYATVGAEEDKAEMFAALLTRSQSLAARLETDAALRAKVALLKERLRATCSWDPTGAPGS